MVFPDIQAAADYLRDKIGEPPRLALVLGSGLGDLAEEVEEPLTIPYASIPGFSLSTAPGHAGTLVCGRLSGKKVLIMRGRFHLYEGYSLDQIVFPIRVFRSMGIARLILTNAAGGANPSFSPGDFMLVRDHVNITGLNPCIGPNDERLGPRFFDMSSAYSPALRRLAHRAGDELGIPLQEGVYVWFTGPCFETPAEIRMAQSIGGDAVGMSTVPEAIAAAHCGLETLGISCITNMAAGVTENPITTEEVFEISAARRPAFAALVRRIVELVA